jgi:hypothetical protein
MTTDYAAIAMHSVVSLFGLALVFVWLIRDHRLDALRQRLFDLRAELFDYADSGAIDFNHHAYCLLRLRMNRLIQFAHRFTSVELLMLGLWPSKANEYEPEDHPLKKWQSAVETVESSEVRDQLREFNQRMMTTLIKHLLCSPLVLVTMPFFVIALFLAGKIKIKVGLRDQAIPVAEKMEGQAYALDASDGLPHTA